jgi:hypothetical protein
VRCGRGVLAILSDDARALLERHAKEELRGEAARIGKVEEMPEAPRKRALVRVSAGESGIISLARTQIKRSDSHPSKLRGWQGWQSVLRT